MRFGMLGPLEAIDDSAVPARLGGPKEQMMLAALVVRANETVSAAQLIDDLWGEDPPRTAAKTIQGYVSRLRRALPGAHIVTAGSGYRLEVEPDDVDANRFARLAFEGRRALDAGDAAAASRLLDEALGLWRGEPLSEFDDAPFAIAEATRLNELRLAVVEDRVAAGLAIGEGDRLVSELQRLVRAHPLRERLWGQLMVALYQSGRQADALTTFQMARRYLVEEAGVEPGEELRTLERAILDQEPSLRAPVPSRPGGVRATVTVTVLLTDIEASTRLWQSESDAMAAAVADHESIVKAAVDAQGGELLKTRGEGDSTFTVFQRASDAATAAVALQRALAQNRWPTREALRVRAAVHTGEVEARDGDYFGLAINRAARLRALATGGQVLLSSTTAGLVADVLPEGVELIDLGSHELRDLARPEHVFALWSSDLGPRPMPAARRSEVPARIDALRRGALVGRASELARLRRAWDSASMERTSLMLVSGEPGIGKTRLVAEVADAAARSGAEVLYGRCDDPPLSPYQPFVEIVQQLAGSPVSGLRDAVSAAPELVSLVPELGRRFPGTSAEYIAGGSDRFHLFSAVAQVVLGQGANRPLLIVIDDLHWADEATLQLLRHVLRAAPSGPTLVIATFRDTELGRRHPLADALAELVRETPVERVDLRGLECDEVREVIGPEHESHASEIWRVTDGNPFFVVEMARYLGEAGDELVVPESIKHVVGRRVMRLGREVDDLLAAGAVVGSEFELDVAAAVAGLDEDQAVDAADAASLAGLVRGLDVDRFAFTHALVRQTLMEELTPSRRIRAHRRVAETIESLHTDDLAAWLGALAHHWAAGGDTTAGGPAFRYSMLAGDRAASLLAWEEAGAHYERATELAQVSGDVHGQVAALTELGETRLVTGDVDRADEALMTALDLARESGDGELFGRAVLSYGTFPRNLAGLGPVAELLEEARARVGDADTPLRAQVLGRLAFSKLFLGPDGAALAHEAYADARRLGDPLAIVMAANAMRFVGPDALDYAVVADCARKLLDTKWAMWALFAESWQASPLFNRGEVQAARAVWDRVVERTRGGIPLAVAQRRLFHALLAGLEGRFNDAERIVSEASEELTFAGDANVLLLAGSVLSAVRRMRGRLVDDIPVLEMMRFARPNVAQARLVLAYAKSSPDQVDQARQELRSLAATGFAAFQDDWLGLFSLGFLARAAVDLGEPDAGRALYDLLAPRSGELLTLHGFLDCLGAVDHHLGLLALLDGRLDAAIAHLRDALAFHERLGWRPLAAETQLALARPLASRDPAQARGLASSALATAVELDMRHVAAEARALLRDLDRPALPAAMETTAPMVGRDDELGTLQRWLESDGPRFALVSGEPGIGKTRLVGAFATDAYARGMTVLYGACDEAGTVPFHPFVSALRDREVRPHTGSVDPEAERFRWFEEVESTLRAAAPVLLVIDDLHWADGDTLSLLRHLLRAGPDDVRITAAYRDTDVDRSRPLRRFLADLWTDHAPLRLDIHGLDRITVGQLLPLDADIDAIHAETEGNPLFVSLVARHLSEGGKGIPQGIRDVVGRRLDHLGDDAVRLLRVAALVGQRFDLGPVADAADMSEGAALAAVEEAAERALVAEVPGHIDRFAFSHAVIAAAVAEELTTSRRVRLHRRLGESLESRGGTDITALARHFCEAAVADVADKAVGYARQAAVGALAVGAWDEAARWLRAAIDALDAGAIDDPSLGAYLEVELGEALAFCGEVIDARTHFDAAADVARKVGDATLLGRAAVGYVGEGIKTSLQETGEDARLDEALAALGAANPALRARLLATKAYWNSYLGVRRETLACAHEAYQIAKDIDDAETLAHALAVIAMLSMAAPSEALERIGQEALQMARRSGNVALETRAAGSLFAAAVGRGDMVEARGRYEHVKVLAAVAKTPRSQWSVEFAQGSVMDTIAGNWEAAEAHADQALEASKGLSVNPFLPLGVYLSSLIPVRWMQGRLGELADNLKWAADTSSGPLLWHSAAAMALVEAGRLDEARDALRPVRHLTDDEFAESLESGAMVCHLAVACGALGETELAARIYERIRDRTDPVCMFMMYLFLGVYDHHRGMLAAAAGWTEVAREHLETAIEQYEAMGATPWAEHARQDLASIS